MERKEREHASACTRASLYEGTSPTHAYEEKQGPGLFLWRSAWAAGLGEGMQREGEACPGLVVSGFVPGRAPCPRHVSDHVCAPCAAGMGDHCFFTCL